MGYYIKPPPFYTNPHFAYTKLKHNRLNYPYLCPMEDKLINGFWWFLEPRHWWLRHLLYWVYRFSNYFLYLVGLREIDFTQGYAPLLGEVLMFMFFFYLHILYLIPKLLFEKKIIRYIMASILSIAFFIQMDYLLYPPDAEITQFDTLHNSFFDCVEFFLEITGLRIMVEFLYTQKRMQELRTENLHTELSYLKSQINPHFLFNTMNNITVLSELYPEKVTPALIRLSNVLRYQLYEGEKEQVPLAKEIENLQQNLQLEVMRLNDVHHDIRVEGNVNGALVAPLLFLPFLENAVKHSADPSGKVFIDIVFKIDNHTLVFTAENSKPPVKARQLAGGIGLKNIRRRLALLYPGKHDLVIEETPSVFKVILTLELK